MSAVTVQELNVYPVKSGRGIALSEVRVTETGFEWDRHWMVIRENGTFLTQRTHPWLATVATRISGESLILENPDAGRLVLPLAPSGTVRAVRVWDDRCEGLDQGEDAAAWISSLAGESLRIVRVPDNPGRVANREYSGADTAVLSFPDGFPLLVCNQASLEDLNRRLPEALPMERFRPNLVIAGLPPFAEDQIDSLTIGPVHLRLVKPCARCIIPSTDQRTGIRGLDPLPTLREFRFDRKLRGVTFGENAIISAGVGESLQVGAQCQVNYENDRPG